MAIDARVVTKMDTASNWEAANPVLLKGERILVQTAAGDLREKVGDGTKRYTQLPFVDEPIYNAITNIASGLDLIAFVDE